MEQTQKLTEEDFYKKYTLIQNPFTKDRSSENTSFETFGKELVFVQERASENVRNIWTVIDCDGWFGIVAGYHWVNRLNHFISNEEWSSIEEEYCISDEGPVNEAYDLLSANALEAIFEPEHISFLSLSGDDLDDAREVAKEQWYEIDIDTREELIEKYKGLK